MSPELLEVDSDRHVAYMTKPFGGDRVNAYEISDVSSAHLRDKNESITILSPGEDLIVLKPVSYETSSAGNEVQAIVHCEQKKKDHFPLHLEVAFSPEAAHSRSLERGFLTAALEVIEEHHPEEIKDGVWIEKPEDPAELMVFYSLGFNAVKLAEKDEILVKVRN